MPSSSSSSKAKKLPSGWTAEQYEAYQARKKAEAKATAEAKEQEKIDKAHAAELKKRYQGRADPTTVEDWVDPDALQEEFFKEAEWKASWVQVEFDGDACVANITGAGKTKDGYYAPAGSTLPLGAAIPEMTILKYGGYFPQGTAFPGGVLVPMHARMVNVLPEETSAPSGPAPSESLCLVQ